VKLFFHQKRHSFNTLKEDQFQNALEKLVGIFKPLAAFDEINLSAVKPVYNGHF
jgi:hypothetical protein